MAKDYEEKMYEQLCKLHTDLFKIQKNLESVAKSLNSLARSAAEMKRAYCYEPISAGMSEEEIEAAFTPIVDTSSIKKGEENHE